MPPQDDPVTESESSASSLSAPLLAAGAFAAGAAAAFLAKRLIDEFGGLNEFMRWQSGQGR